MSEIINRYVYNGKEVSREVFIEKAKNCFKWFSGSYIYSESDDYIRERMTHTLNYQDVQNNCSDKSSQGLFQKVKNDLEKFQKIREVEENDKTSLNLDQKPKTGKKESQTVKKAPIYTFCKQFKNAIEVLAFRSSYGHEKYEEGDDWENFARVENGDFEYSNASFRHALGIGEESDEEHRIAEAWNAIAKLEIYLRNNLHN